MRVKCKRNLRNHARIIGFFILLSFSLLIFHKYGFVYGFCSGLPLTQTRYFQKAPPAPAADVLLLGYMRGGSTFIGEILGIRQNQFYVYEPLHKMAKYEYFKPGFVCNIMNATCSVSKLIDAKSIEILHSIYKCDFATFNKEILPWQLLKVNATKLPECEYREPLCWSQILKSCHASSSRVSKVLRLTVGLASKLLDKLPNLKIVYLLRDPRAIIDSRLRGSGNTTQDEIKSLCNKIREDYKDSMRIQRQYPGRFLVVFYEDIATSPMQASKLFDFVGFQSGTDDFLHIHSMIKSPINESVYNTFRSDSNQTARKWRRNIPWHVAVLVNSECSDVYELFGYPQLQNQRDLLNDSIPLRI